VNLISGSFNFSMHSASCQLWHALSLTFNGIELALSVAQSPAVTFPDYITLLNLWLVT
jgi:hypothetical protein